MKLLCVEKLYVLIHKLFYKSVNLLQLIVIYSDFCHKRKIEIFIVGILDFVVKSQLLTSGGLRVILSSSSSPPSLSSWT